MSCWSKSNSQRGSLVPPSPFAMFVPRAVQKKQPQQQRQKNESDGTSGVQAGPAQAPVASPAFQPPAPRRPRPRVALDSRPDRAPQRPSRSDVNKKRGAFPHGNYSNYYGNRDPLSFASSSADLDPRVGRLKSEWFPKDARVLDIGCNGGLVTVAVAQHFAPSLALGLDIDPSLIKKAESFLAHRYSFCKPLLAAEDTTDGLVARKLNASCTDFSHFPVSAVNAFGPLPILHPSKLTLLEPDGSPGNLRGFPWNVKFAVSDWTSTSSCDPPENPEQEWTGDERSSFDVVLALSLTKWIHLNNGDAGLLSFFRKLRDVLKPGGILILEPQPWSSYLKRAEPTELMALKIRPEGFVEELGKVGLELVEVLKGVEPEKGEKKKGLFCTERAK